MAADEEFRKVAEDMRELMRSLRSDLRAAKWDAKTAAHDARRDWREYRRSGVWPHQQHWSQHWGPGGPSGWTPPPPSWGAPPPPAPPPPATPAGAAPPGAPAGTDPGTPPDATSQAGAAPPGAPAGTDPGTPPYAPEPGASGGPPPPYGAHQWGARPYWPWGPYNGPPPGSRAATATATPVRSPKPERPKAPPVRHKRDGSTLLSLLLVLAGLAWLGSAAGVVNLSLETVLATILVVLGAGMVITARTDWSLSRRHWPVWLGLVVLLLVLASSTSGGIPNGVSNLHFGPTNVTLTSWADLGTPITNFAGPIVVDLSAVTPSGADQTLRIHDVFGPVGVTLPADLQYSVHVKAHTSFGPVSLLNDGRRRGGGAFTSRTTDLAGPPGAPTLTLDITDAFGPITVTQGTSPSSPSPKPSPPSAPKPPSGP